MLEEIGTKENIPKFIEKVKNKETLLMGFGHRVYKNYDPRAKIVKKVNKSNKIKEKINLILKDSRRSI